MTLPVAILCGGLATRLYPATRALPKSLIPIHGEPFLAHQLRLVRGAGARRIVLCVGHLGEQIQAFAGTDGIEYSWDGPEPRGTAGAIRQALPLLGDAFLVLYGDSYLPTDYGAVEQALHRAGQPALMTVYRNEGRWDASNVEFDRGRIVAYDKQHRSERMRHIDYGLGAFRPEALDGPESDLADLYSRLLREHRLAAFEVHERFYEIGSAEGQRELERYLR